jgi:uncharacterized protein YqjF (DUF2071 family)
VNTLEQPPHRAIPFSEQAKARMLQSRFEPMFIADWERVLMIHFTVDAAALQRDVPFPLDLHDGHAFVTVVAFTMRDMRPAIGGRLAAWPFRAIATHDFLNVRTYVRVDKEVGIHFLTEWVSNRLAVMLGPRTFSLPYRHGKIHYQNDCALGKLRGRVVDARTGVTFQYRAELQYAGSETGAPFTLCKPGSFDEWLMERYSAFNSVRGRHRFFRVWHEPWEQCRAHVETTNVSLLRNNWSWFRDAGQIGANYSPFARDVWLGRPHKVSRVD